MRCCGACSVALRSANEFLSVVEQQHHDLQHVARSIRAQPKLAARAALILTQQWVGDQEPTRCVDGVLVSHAVLAPTGAPPPGNRNTKRR